MLTIVKQIQEIAEFFSIEQKLLSVGATLGIFPPYNSSTKTHRPSSVFFLVVDIEKPLYQHLFQP